MLIFSKRAVTLLCDLKNFCLTFTVLSSSKLDKFHSIRFQVRTFKQASKSFNTILNTVDYLFATNISITI